MHTATGELLLRALGENPEQPAVHASGRRQNDGIKWLFSVLGLARRQRREPRRTSRGFSIDARRLVENGGRYLRRQFVEGAAGRNHKHALRPFG